MGRALLGTRKAPLTCGAQDDESTGDGRNEHRLRSRGPQRPASRRTELCTRILAPRDERHVRENRRKRQRAGPGLQTGGRMGTKRKSRFKGLRRLKKKTKQHKTKNTRMEFLEHLAFLSIKNRFRYVESTYVVNAIHASLETVRFLESRRSQMLGVLHRSPLGLTGQPGPTSPRSHFPTTAPARKLCGII